MRQDDNAALGLKRAHERDHYFSCLSLYMRISYGFSASSEV